MNPMKKSKNLLSNADVDAILQGYRVRADQIMVWTLGFLALLSFAVAAATDSLTIAIFVATPAVLVPLWLTRVAPGSLATRLAVAIALMVFALLSIQLAKGMLEAHFGIFVLLVFFAVLP